MAEKIKGYRDLTPNELALINECKEMGVRVGDLCDKISLTPDTDFRWTAIGKTNLQQGFMALTRSIAKPETF